MKWKNTGSKVNKKELWQIKRLHEKRWSKRLR